MILQSNKCNARKKITGEDKGSNGKEWSINQIKLDIFVGLFPFT